MSYTLVIWLLVLVLDQIEGEKLSIFGCFLWSCISQNSNELWQILALHIISLIWCSSQSRCQLRLKLCCIEPKSRIPGTTQLVWFHVTSEFLNYLMWKVKADDQESRPRHRAQAVDRESRLSPSCRQMSSAGDRLSARGIPVLQSVDRAGQLSTGMHVSVYLILNWIRISILNWTPICFFIFCLIRFPN